MTNILLTVVFRPPFFISHSIREMNFTYKHYAYVSKSNKILSSGSNGHSGGRNLSKSICTTHAEVDALKSLMKYKKRKRSKLCMTSEAHDGQTYRNSMPCIHCCRAMLKFGIRRISYYNGCEWVCEDIQVTEKKAKLSSGDKCP